MPEIDESRLLRKLKAHAKRVEPDLGDSFEIESAAREAVGVRVHWRGFRMMPLDPKKPGEAFLPIPVTGEARFGTKGEVTSFEVQAPAAEDVEEARAYTRSLLEMGAVEGEPSRGRSKRPESPTHAFERDPKGRKVLRRRRFH